MKEYLSYASDVWENTLSASRPQPIPGTYAGGNNWTAPFAVNAPTGQSIGAVLVEGVATITTSSTAAPTAGTDVLDLIVQGYQVADGPGMNARCRAISRAGIEEAERIYTNPGNTSYFKYPRSSASTLASTGAVVTSDFIIPCGGGDAVSIMLQTPGLNTVYSGITGLSIAYTFVAIPTADSCKNAFNQLNTPPLSSGTNDIAQLGQPTDINAKLVSFIGSTAGSFSQIQVYDDQGKEVVNYLTATQLQAAQGAYPSFATNTANTVINQTGVHASRFVVNLVSSASTGLSVLYTTILGQTATSPTAPSQPTAAPAAVNRIGTSVPGTVGSQPAGSAGALRGILPPAGARRIIP